MGKAKIGSRTASLQLFELKWMLRICRHVSPSSRDFRAMTEVGDWFSMPLSQALDNYQMLHLESKFGAMAVDKALGNA